MAQTKKPNNNALPPDLAKTDAGLFLRDFAKDPEYRFVPGQEPNPLYIKGLGNCVSISTTKLKVINDDGTSYPISIREAYSKMDRDAYIIPETPVEALSMETQQAQNAQPETGDLSESESKKDKSDSQSNITDYDAVFNK